MLIAFADPMGRLNGQHDVAANVELTRPAGLDICLKKRLTACNTRIFLIFVSVLICGIYIASPNNALNPPLGRNFDGEARRAEKITGMNQTEPVSVQTTSTESSKTSTPATESTLKNSVASLPINKFNGLPIDSEARRAENNIGMIQTEPVYVQPTPTESSNTSTPAAQSTLKNSETSSTTNKAVEFNGLPIDDTRVAFCICGTARTFHYAGVHKNIMKKMVEPIRATHKTDIFFIVRMDDDAAPTRPLAKTERNKTYEAMHSFDPVSITTYTDMTGLNQTRYRERVGSHPVHMISPQSCGFQPPKILDLSHTMFRTQQCLDVVAAHERKQRFRYGWMYRVRTDTVLVGKQPFITPSQMKRDVMYISSTIWNSNRFDAWWKVKHRVKYAGNGSIGDQLFAASRQVAEVGFKSFNIMNDCEAYEMPQPNVESSLRMWLVKQNVTYYPMPWMWVIVRDTFGPLCHWLDRLHVPGTSFESRSMECQSFRKEHAFELPGARLKILS